MFIQIHIKTKDFNPN